MDDSHDNDVDDVPDEVDAGPDNDRVLRRHLLRNADRLCVSGRILSILSVEHTYRAAADATFGDSAAAHFELRIRN